MIILLLVTASDIARTALEGAPRGASRPMMFFLTLSLLLMGALLARFIASLIRIPEILVLVAFGAAFGPFALDVVDIPFDSLGAQLMFTLGVSLILFYGGLSLSLPILRRSGSPSACWRFPGVVITALVSA